MCSSEPEAEMQQAVKNIAVIFDTSSTVARTTTNPGHDLYCVYRITKCSSIEQRFFFFFFFSHFSALTFAFMPCSVRQALYAHHLVTAQEITLFLGRRNVSPTLACRASIPWTHHTYCTVYTTLYTTLPRLSYYYDQTLYFELTYVL